MLRRMLFAALALAFFQAPTPAQTARADVEVAYPTFGVALTGPPGWTPLSGGGSGTIARWGKVDARTGEVLALVTAEVEPNSADTEAQYALKLSKRIGGKTPPAPADLGGAKALRVSPAPDVAPLEGSNLRPAGVLLTRRGRNVYLLSAFESPAERVAPAFDAARAGWKWIALEPAAKYVQDLAAPSPAIGRFSLGLPTIARPFDVKDPRSQLHLGVYDYAARRPAMEVELVALSTGGDPAKVRAYVSQQVTDRLGPGQSVTWSDKGGNPRRWVSSSFEKPVKDESGASVVSVARYALVELNEREAGLLTLQYVVAKPQEKDVYEAANDAIVRSIQAAEPAAGQAARTPAASAPPAPAGPRGDGSIQIKRKPKAPAKSAGH